MTPLCCRRRRRPVLSATTTCVTPRVGSSHCTCIAFGDGDGRAEDRSQERQEEESQRDRSTRGKGQKTLLPKGRGHYYVSWLASSTLRTLEMSRTKCSTDGAAAIVWYAPDPKTTAPTWRQPPTARQAFESGKAKTSTQCGCITSHRGGSETKTRLHSHRENCPPVWIILIFPELDSLGTHRYGQVRACRRVSRCSKLQP